MNLLFSIIIFDVVNWSSTKEFSSILQPSKILKKIVRISKALFIVVIRMIFHMRVNKPLFWNIFSEVLQSSKNIFLKKRTGNKLVYNVIPI